MGFFKGLLGMKPMQPTATGRTAYSGLPESDLEKRLEHMKDIPATSEATPSLAPSFAIPPGAPLLGLRIDVDTHEGMRDGVPKLLEILNRSGVRGTFYLAIGPDKSGRAIFHALTPGFLAKMFRSGAPKIYSMRTMLSGTLLPARPVATAFPEIARRIVAEGHEAGVHAWDHRTWQDKLNKKHPDWAANELEKAFDGFVSIFGDKPKTFAAPAWLCNNESLIYEENFGLAYASDCRGTDPFLPVIDVRILKTPQVPTTLPTLDEALGNTHKDAAAFYGAILEELKPGTWPVLTVHAEIEGGPFASQFEAFLAKARERGITVVTLRDLLAARLATSKPLPRCTLSYAAVDGRHGVVSMQMFEV
jgi:peptidoglycan/xylan/chitin deacetylase (PgdA/CDA1 family)